MATKFMKVLNDNGDLIKNLFGNIDNVVVKDNANEVFSMLSNEEKTKNDADRYRKLSNSYSNTTLDDKDMYDTTKSIDYGNADFSNSGTLIGDRYSKYLESLRTQSADGTLTAPHSLSGQGSGNPESLLGPKTPLTFEDYIKNDPVAAAELQKYVKETQTPIDESQVKKTRYKKAGFSDDDTEFYDNYNPPDVLAHNQKLVDVLNTYGPKLQSTGSYGNDFAKLLSDKLQGLQLPEEKPVKYNTKYDEKTGKLIYYSDDPSQETFTKQVTTPEVKHPEFKGAKIMQDKDGNYIWYNKVWDETKGDFVDKKIGDANEQEIKDFELEQLKKSVAEDKLLNPNSGRTSRRRSSKSGKKSSKGGFDMTSTDAKLLNGKLKKYAELNKAVKGNIEDSHLPAKDKKLYRELQTNLLEGYFKGDTTALNEYANKYLKAGKKGIPGILQSILGDTASSDTGTVDNTEEDNAGMSEDEIAQEEMDNFDEEYDQIDLNNENGLLLARHAYDLVANSDATEKTKKHAKNKYLQSIGAK